MFVELNSYISQDDNAASFHLQDREALGNSEATGFGSLRCQVQVRSGDGGSLAVYLKKGRLAELDGSGPQWLTCSVFGAAFQQGTFREGPGCPQPRGRGGSFCR